MTEEMLRKYSKPVARNPTAYRIVKIINIKYYRRKK